MSWFRDYLWSSRHRQSAGMTLLELVVATAIFSIVLVSAYTALQSMRNFTVTNTSQVDLQEEARHALEDISQILRNSGRFPDNSYPKVYLAVNSSGVDQVPTGCQTANNHPFQNPPKAQLGTIVNGGDPTLPSAEILFRVPKPDLTADPSGQTPTQPVFNTSTNTYSVVWDTLADGVTPKEYGFFLLPTQNQPNVAPAPAGTDVAHDPDWINVLVYRDSSMTQEQTGKVVQGRILARFVDRIQIQEYPNPVQGVAALKDASLTASQIRVTLYLSRQLDPSYPKKVITVSLSTVVDMRNDQFQ